jgi:hypothetical protein
MAVSKTPLSRRRKSNFTVYQLAPFWYTKLQTFVEG